MNLSQIEQGDWVRYANVDFGTAGAVSFQARVASPLDGGEIELHLDHLDGPLIGTGSVPDTGGWQNWQNISCPVTGARGVHFLYMKFGSLVGNTTGLFNVEWYQFKP